MATKKKAVVKKAVAVVKKAATKKKATVKKAVPKKKAAVKKAVAVVKKTTPKKKTTVKKVVPKKKAAVKKVVAKKTVAKKKPVSVKKATVKKAEAIVKPIAEVAKQEPRNEKQETRDKRPLSRNQLKKSSAKKRSSERETLLDATYSSNPKTPKTTLPVDPKALKLCKAIVNAIEEKKGNDIVCLDLRNIENRVCDYFIICDGNSTTQIEAIAGSVEFLVKRDLGERPYRSEGYENKTWILIDYVNVIVHIFDKETRYFYNLESLWADGEKIKF
ncbi:MAG TPA: ribosome silencing factor [Bacteroidia bacterium]|nr:ribosome silencing factor [Bacteroidia bacterium]